MVKEEHMAFMKYADKSGDGYLSYAERQNAMNLLKDNTAEQLKLKGLYSASQNISEGFNTANADSKNNISKDEFVAYIQKLGATKAEAEALFNNVMNNVMTVDGKIDIYEFNAFVEYADSINGNKDGKISKEELIKAMSKLNTDGEIARTTENNALIDSRRKERYTLTQLREKAVRSLAYDYDYLVKDKNC
jgi:Ca2+-binding EF-hand superfamily protein